MVNYALKIKELRKYLSLTQEQFATDTGISRSRVSQIEIGKFKPTLGSLTDIARIYNIDVNYFFNEEFNISIGTKKADGKKEVGFIESSIKSISPVTGIPYYETLPASAGDFASFLNQSKPTAYINLPQLSDCIALLPVYGSSMKGVVEAGDLIAIKEVKSRDEFDPATPYLVITDEHRMIKYLHADETDGTLIWAESTNHARIKLHVESIKMVYAIKCVVRFY